MYYSVEEKVKWFAISSRIFIFTLQFVANYFITDHKPGVFTKPRQFSPNQENNIIQVVTEGLTRWDAQYFLHIAEYGYTYENTLAFFPLFPFTLRLLSHPFQILVNNAFHISAIPFFLTSHDTLVLMSIVLNSVLFVHSALLLYKLTLKVTDNEKVAYASAILFCVNPASIFFSAAYSETLFWFLSLNAMLHIEADRLIWGSIIIGLSAMTRSNGLVNIGYVAYRLVSTRRSLIPFIFALIILIFCILIAILPFISYQFYCYAKFCVIYDHYLPEFIVKHAQINEYVLTGNQTSPWCFDTIPLAYAYVQKHYWNVGFLRYYEVKQIPNFILAFPVLLFTFYGVHHFFRSHGWILVYLGSIPGSASAVLPTSCFPYVFHALALALFGTLCMHVQVTTRLIFSSCPAIYWFCARIIVTKMSQSKEAKLAVKLSRNPNVFYEPVANLNSRWKTLLLSERFLGLSLFVRYYFFAYFLAGPIIFANNLPWT